MGLHGGGAGGNGARRRPAQPGFLLGAVLALLLTALAGPAAAQAVTIHLSVAPLFPATVTVGQANQPAQLSIVNEASSGVGPITLTQITLNPACGSLSLDCSPPDPGVFSLSATANGTGGACAGRVFDVTPPDANGRSLFNPVGGPVVLATPGQANSSCLISFTFNVLKAPTIDAMPAAVGLQTAHVATVTGSGTSGGSLTATGTARGLQTSNVLRAQPTIATKVSAPVDVGGTITDTATVSGPVAVTGTVTFAVYGPDNATCSGPPVFTSTKALAANTATSDPYTATAPGVYRFVATYNGDANNNPVSGTCGDPAETVTVGDDGSRYHPLTPARILDSRFGTPIGPGATVDLQVTGQGGVPSAGVTAVVLNVTVTAPTSGGYLTVFPAGTPRPTVSNVNFVPGDTVPNLVVVKVGTAGRVSLFNATGNTHVIADVAGWYGDGETAGNGRYVAVVPSRLVDTRLGVGGTRLPAGGTLEVQVAARGGVPPSGAQAAVLNVTVTNPTATSYLTVHPTGEARPNASNLNFDAGETVANRVFARLGSGGRVTIFNASGSADVIVDVGGWYTDASLAGQTGSYTPLQPARIVDTRLGLGLPTRPVANGTVDVQVTGRGGVPASGVSAVALNVTAVGPDATGYLTLYPTGAARPNASDLNFAPNETRANLVVVAVGSGGRVGTFSSQGTHLIFDVAGWYS